MLPVFLFYAGTLQNTRFGMAVFPVLIFTVKKVFRRIRYFY
jgi:hypothetical protein